VNVIGELKIQQAQSKQVGEIQVAVFRPEPVRRKPMLNVWRPASVVSAIHHYLIEPIAGLLAARFNQAVDFSKITHDITSSALQFVSNKSMHDASLRNQSVAGYLVDSWSTYQKSKSKFMSALEIMQEPLFMINCSFGDHLISMITCHSPATNHILDRIELNGYGWDKAREYKYILEDYIGIHFLMTGDYNFLVEQNISGLKFYKVSLHHGLHGTRLTDESKNKRHLRSHNIDNDLFINYCPYHPIEYRKPPAGLIGSSMAEDIASAFTEKDAHSVRVSIVDYLLRNGYELTSKKYVHPYAVSILEELKQMDSNALYEYKLNLADKTMAFGLA
jgi:hypothetical protein